MGDPWVLITGAQITILATQLEITPDHIDPQSPETPGADQPSAEPPPTDMDIRDTVPLWIKPNQFSG